MKNLRLLLLLLLMTNCTTDSPELQEQPITFSPQLLTCVDNLPQLKITNNSTLDFDVAVYGQDYSIQHSQILATSEATDWIELSVNEIVVAATNNVVYGQKIQLSLLPCDTFEVELNATNELIISGI